MSIAVRDDIVVLEGACLVEEAEVLLRALQAHPARKVDLTGVGHLHAAVAQVLLALRPVVLGPAGDAFVNAWIEPILTRPDDMTIFG